MQAQARVALVLTALWVGGCAGSGPAATAGGATTTPAPAPAAAPGGAASDADSLPSNTAAPAAGAADEGAGAGDASTADPASVELLKGELARQYAKIDELERRLDGQGARITELEARLGRDERLAAAGSAGGRPGPSAYRPREFDPGAVYAVAIDGAPSVGPRNAPITLVRSYEFACPYCYKSKDTVDQLLQDYRGKIKVVYRNFVVHPQARLAAQATCAAQRQGHFEKVRQLLWSQGYEHNRDFSAANIDAIARQAGLNMSRFEKDLNGDCVDIVRKDQAELTALGQTGTPTFWINGRTLVGAQPIDSFKSLIDAELALYHSRIGKHGTTRGNYYKKWVLEAGKKKLD